MHAHTADRGRSGRRPAAQPTPKVARSISCNTRSTQSAWMPMAWSCATYLLPGDAAGGQIGLLQIAARAPRVCQRWFGKRVSASTLSIRYPSAVPGGWGVIQR